MKKLNATELRIICSNEDSVFNYSAWPTVARLPDGVLAMVTSGMRMKHVDPFGKVVICYSRDEGRHWSLPAIAMDTALDDRDGGLAVFGNGRVMVTSFNNSLRMQRDQNRDRLANPEPLMNAQGRLLDAYLNVVEAMGVEQKYLGSTYRISEDGGYSFGPVKKAPVTCPHGPCALKDGGLLYVGRRFSDDDSFRDPATPFIQCWKLNDRDEFEYLSAIENITADGQAMLSCEPHAIELPDGRILVHIRVQDGGGGQGKKMFTIYQSESFDGGRTFTRPVQILEDMGGSPPHLMLHSSGVLVCSYARRADPKSIRVMFSRDLGRTWDTEYILTQSGKTWDLGYPATVELKDGSLLTVYYLNEGGVARIYQVNWMLPESK